MKRLYLVRHAKSSWKNPDLADFDRPLNKRGKRDTPAMANRLKEQGVSPDLILSSPAKRALKTARVIARATGYPKKKIRTDRSIYSDGQSAILELLRSLDHAISEVMVFGHNPDLTVLAEDLSGYRVSNIPTCGIFCVDFDIDAWQDLTADKGRFVSFDYPKKHE